MQALGVILKFWLVDDLYNWPHQRVALVNLVRTPGFVARLARRMRPLLGDAVLEMGAGIGTFSGQLMGRRTRYLACEHDPLLLHALDNRFLRTPNVETSDLAPDDEAGFSALAGGFDTVICLHVLESVEDPAAVLRNAAAALKPGGRLILLAPQGPGLYGSLERAMGVRRRFRAAELAGLLAGAGFAVEQTTQLNRAAAPLWWLNSRVLGRKTVSKLFLKTFDKTLWLWALADKLLPWKGLSILLTARKTV